jgi:hypothetical protein
MKRGTASYSPRRARREGEEPTNPPTPQKPPRPRTHGAKRHRPHIRQRKNRLLGGGGRPGYPVTRPRRRRNQSLRRLRNRNAMERESRLHGTPARKCRRNNWRWKRGRTLPRSYRCLLRTRLSSSETRRCERRRSGIPRGRAGAAPAYAVGAPALSLRVASRMVLRRTLIESELTRVAIPHADVETSRFYTHIETSLPEPRRMRQLLTWCATRALLEKPRPADQKSDTETLAIESGE